MGGMEKTNEKIKKIARDFVSRTVEFYGELGKKPFFTPSGRAAEERLGKQEIPEEGRDLSEVYEEMLGDVYSHVLFSQHPRAFSCVPSTASLISWMGDVMTNAFNPHAACKVNAPAADLVERKLVRWMADLAGYPGTAGGIFVSGGSVANLTALTAARDARLTGEERAKAVVYVSDQTHSSVAKGLLVIGFFPEQIRKIPCDALFRMDVSRLNAEIEADLAAGRKPFAVVGSAGTTNTGSVDPLGEISSVCKKYGMWFHVDGAYGATALLSGRGRERLRGIELSDSLSWDAHKWMLQTYGCSLVLVRDRADLVRSFAAHPEYLKDAETSEDGVEFWDLGPELTRPARSLKLWFTLQVLGSREFGRIVDHGCALSELAEKTVRAREGWEVVSPASLAVVNFRFVPEGLTEEERDEVNCRASKEITESGFAQVYTTELCGRKVLRLCTIHPETTEEDVLETVARLAKYASAAAEDVLRSRR